jgi:WD40 repeat protein
VIEGHDGGGAILASLFSPDGRWLATAGEDGTVRLHPLDSLGAGDAAGIVLRDEESPVSLEFSPDGRWLITGGPGSAFERQLTVRLWDLTAPDVAASARALRGHETGIDLVASSPGGRWLLTSAGGDRGGVRLWDLRADDPTACAVVLPGEPLRFPIVRFSPDDRWLFTSSYQRTPQLWDLARADPGAAPVALRGHVFPRVTASVSADSRWLVTADGDLEAPKRAGQSCRVWELAARDVGASAALVPVEQGGATRMATVGDRWLLTAGAPGVRLWHLGVRALLDVARRAAGGELRAEEVREVWEARGR